MHSNRHHSHSPSPYGHRPPKPPPPTRCTAQHRSAHHEGPGRGVPLPNPRDEDRKGCLVAESTRVHGGWIENSAWWLAARVRQCNENELQGLRHCGTWITWNDHTQDVRSWQHSFANEINRPTGPRLIFLWPPASEQQHPDGPSATQP